MKPVLDTLIPERKPAGHRAKTEGAWYGVRAATGTGAGANASHLSWEQWSECRNGDLGLARCSQVTESAARRPAPARPFGFLLRVTPLDLVVILD